MLKVPVKIGYLDIRKSAMKDSSKRNLAVGKMNEREKLKCWIIMYLWRLYGKIGLLSISDT